MNHDLVTLIWTIIPAQPINMNQQTDTFTWREKLKRPKPDLKITKSTPPEIADLAGGVDLVIFDPRFSLGTLMRANYAT